MKANDKGLKAYIDSFYRYGNLDSDFWFIGKEEAGSAKDIEARVSAWSKLKELNVLDNYEFHSEFATQKENPNCYNNLFKGKDATLQPTWNGLVKLQLAIEKGALASIEVLKEFQSNKFGRKNSNNATLELFPLPYPEHNSKSKSHNYSTVSDLPYLETKEKYKTAVVEKRIKALKELIFNREKKPKFVIFYSTDKEFITYWKRIIDIPTSQNDKIKIKGRDIRNRYLFLEKVAGITFCITQHPTYAGTSDEELLESGLEIKKFSKK